MAEQPECSAIGPVQVVRIEEQRLPPCDVGKHLHDSVEEEQTFFMCGELLPFRKRAEARFDLGSELRDLSGSFTENLAQVFVTLLFAHPAAKRFYKRKVRRRCFVLVTTTRQHDCAVNRGLDRDLARETTLACARLTAEKHRMSASFTSAFP